MGKKIFRLVVVLGIIGSIFWYSRPTDTKRLSNPSSQNQGSDSANSFNNDLDSNDNKIVSTVTEKIIGFGQKNRDKVQGGKELVVSDTSHQFDPKFTPKKKVTPPVSLPHTNVTVYLYEWGIDVSDKSIQAGTVSFTVKNNGRFSHNFSVNGQKDFGKILPGQVITFDPLCLSVGDFVLSSNKKIDQERNMNEFITVQ